MAENQYTDVGSHEELTDALDNLAEAIRFTADFESMGRSSYLVDRNLVIDLNGHTVTLGGVLLPRNNISLTIDDLTEGKNGVLKGTALSLVTNAVPGDLIIRNGTLMMDDGSSGSTVISVLKDGSCILEGGTIKAPRHGRAIENVGHLAIQGGTIIGADGGLSPVYTSGEGVTDMTDGAVYAGNYTVTTCFETVSYEDPTWGWEIATLKLPEGVHDGGAVVLDGKWAIPGTRYINYHLPEGALISHGKHYYVPGTEFGLPGCDYFNNLPFAGWSRTEDGDELLNSVDASMDEDLELYPVWKYVNIAPGVATDMIPVSLDPEPGTVESLSSLTLSFGDAFGDLYLKEEGVETYGYVTRKLTGEKVSDITITTDWDGIAYVSLETPLVKNGTYELFIPAGVIGNDDYYYDDYQSGSCNPDLRYEYRINNESSEPDRVETDPADGATVASLHTIKFVFVDEEDVFNGYIDETVTLRDAGGNIVGELSSYDMESVDNESNAMQGTFAEEIVAPGVYTLHVPAGFFAFDWWERDCSEQTFTYTVVGNPSSVERTGAAVLMDVYDLSGNRVLSNAGEEEIRRLPKGIYITNGKKILVR